MVDIISQTNENQFLSYDDFVNESYNKNFKSDKASLLLIKSYFENFFKRNKEIHSVGWVQYTPYFNDGEVCNFYVYSDNIYINGVKLYKDFKLQIEEIRVFLNEIPDAVMKSIFEEGHVVFNFDNNKLTFTVDYDRIGISNEY